MDESRSQALFRRIQSGEREAAAEFVLHYEPQIRRRIRGKLGRRLRRLFDTQDILSTLLRRLDVFILRHNLQAESDQQMWSLVMQIAETAILEKGRLMQRLKRRDEDGSFVAQAIGACIQAAPEEDFDLGLSNVFECVDDAGDQQILWMWLAGYEHRVSAQILGISHDAVRKRWERLKDRIRVGIIEHEKA